MRGNVMDMAVGVIIGGAFGKIVSSLVNDVVMPPLGMALGKMDFSNLFISLNGKEYATLEAAKKAGAPVLAYGSFINSVLDFLILAFVIFIMIRQINKLTPEPSLHRNHVCALTANPRLPMTQPVARTAHLIWNNSLHFRLIFGIFSCISAIFTFIKSFSFAKNKLILYNVDYIYRLGCFLQLKL